MKSNLKLCLCLCLVTMILAFNPKKQDILIIGDSISNGYTPFVQEQLSDIANVVHNPGNARHSGFGLDNIESWIGDKDWDIIHFNWGLWDLCYRHPESTVQGNRDKVNGEITFDIETYEENLDAIVLKIKKISNAKLIFATTTFVPENEAGRFKKDARKYNAVAKKVMKKHQIQINDMFKISKRIHRHYGIGDDDVHYTNEGYEMLGRHIANYLKTEIEE